MTGMRSELAKTLKSLPPESGRRLKVALAYRDIRQNQFARAIGADETKVSRALNGYRPWTADERAKAAELLDLPEDLLFPEAIAS